ncbi:hypothetical protein IT570_09940 [Candidatus Sumerlaeota bacterium]|nr:hypothetical protein [Candidatus Sumerlaeota bacterium]
MTFRSNTGRSLFAALLYLCIASLQIYVFTALPRYLPSGKLDGGLPANPWKSEEIAGPWFLYGTDTVYHDAIVHNWVMQQSDRDPSTIPLWLPGLQGGLPTLGAFLWTPFAPASIPFHVLPYPAAQKLAWMLCLWFGGCSAYGLARALRIGWLASIFSGTAWMLCGHVVTLIHAGHFQKVMALSWLPAAAAGGIMMADLNSAARRFRGLAVTALAIGAMFLSGHPQIAYVGALLVGGWLPWSFIARRRLMRFPLRQASLTMLAVVVGGAIASVQLIPGLEMAGLSNRGGAGVDYEEATKTSYPPEELWEYVAPRLRGTSIRDDPHQYFGRWHERLVSDYAGKIVVLLAIAGIFNSRRSRYSVFWLLVTVASILVGLGKFGPLFPICYDFLPGFKSFRSPGTFMCAAALGIAMLSGYGLDAILHGLRSRTSRGVSRLVYAGVLVLTIADLGYANRFFLLKESWASYYGGYLAPNELDMWLIDHGIMQETHNEAREFRFRQILAGGPALNGYHPIYYAVKGALDPLRNEDYGRWLSLMGISHVIVDSKYHVSSPKIEVASFPNQFAKVVKVAPTRAEVFRETAGADAKYQWVSRTPNDQVLLVSGNGGPLSVPEIRAPGHNLLMDGRLVREFLKPALATEIQLEPGEHRLEWRYKPASYRVGLFGSAIGLALAFGIMVLGFLHRPPASRHLYEEGAPNPQHGRPLFHRDLEVTRHSHAQDGQVDP